jgi:hypothetical protein
MMPRKIPSFPRIFAHFYLFLLLSLLSTGSGLSQQRAGSDAKAAGNEPKAPAFLFVSPNTQSGLSLAQARRKLSSPSEFLLMKRTRALLACLGSEARLSPALGSWTDGVENSLLVRSSMGEQIARYTSSVLGRDAHQKAVMFFRVTPKGQSRLYVLKGIRPALSQVIRELDRTGIAFRTIVQSSHGAAIYVVDEHGGALQTATRRAAKRLKATLSTLQGISEMIGDSDSAESAGRSFDQIIKSFEESHPDVGGQCSSAGRSGMLMSH